MKKVKIFLKVKRVKIKDLALSLALITIISAPFFSLAGQKSIYVNANASGVQDGTKSHPFKTIGQALKKADEGDKVKISEGSYYENIKIPEGVEVHGSGKSKVFIIAADKDEAVVKMNHKTKIVGVTVQKGKYGIEVGSNDKAKIINCIIRKNKRDGIRIKEGSLSEKNRVEIIGNEISDNGHNGISSQSRKLIVNGNWIAKNESDGIEFESYVNVWMEKNAIEKNNGSGMKLVLDQTDISAVKNLFQKNKREGIEINNYGKFGRLIIGQSSIKHNNRWGIARVQRSAYGFSAWKGVQIKQPGVDIFDNDLGNISPIIRQY